MKTLNYSKDTVLTALLDFISKNPPAWATNTIEHWNDVFDRSEDADILKFVTRENYISNARVDMREVVGQWDHYARQTWLEAVSNPQYRPGKMSSAFNLYETNPDYYFSGELAGGIHLSSLNGGPWFSIEGNHRTVVAKFACERLFREIGVYPEVTGVSQHAYYADLDARNLYRRMRTFEKDGIHVSVERNRVGETHIGNVRSDTYEVKFHVADHRFRSKPRMQWLPAAEFKKFAQHILRTNGVVSRKDRFQHFWLWFVRSDLDSLIYEGARGS
jgi:hypothetical protein